MYTTKTNRANQLHTKNFKTVRQDCFLACEVSALVQKPDNSTIIPESESSLQLLPNTRGDEVNILSWWDKVLLASSDIGKYLCIYHYRFYIIYVENDSWTSNLFFFSGYKID